MILRRRDEKRARDCVVVATNGQSLRKEIGAETLFAIVRVAMAAENAMSYRGLSRL